MTPEQQLEVIMRNIEDETESIPLRAVACKIESVRRAESLDPLEQPKRSPRLFELLLSVQGASMRPGGLLKFVREFLVEFRGRIGTAGMCAIIGAKYTLKQKLTIWHEMPNYARPSLPEGASANAEILLNSTPAELEELKPKDRHELESALAEFTPELFRKICERHAMKRLPDYLVRLCTEARYDPEAAAKEEQRERQSWDAMSRGTGGPGNPDAAWPGPTSDAWYFDDPVGPLIEYVDRCAQKIQNRLAMTAVAKIILENADTTFATNEAAMIRGESRFGKTESLKTVCDMRPGRWRYVEVPPGNPLRQLIVRIAESFGIEKYSTKTIEDLCEEIRYIVRWTGLGVVFDEGARLIPNNPPKSGEPPRMSWIRSVLLDQYVPTMIGVTPKWYDKPFGKFVEKTGYAKEQWTGRFMPIELPATLDKSDLILVAAGQFPEIKSKADLFEIACQATASDRYLHAIRQLSKRARYIAERDHLPFAMDVIRVAIAQLFPKPAKLADTTASVGMTGAGASTAPRRNAKSAASRSIKAGLKPISGGVQPGRFDIARDGASGGSFARGADADSVKTDPLLVEV